MLSKRYFNSIMDSRVVQLICNFQFAFCKHRFELFLAFLLSTLDQDKRSM